MTPTPAPRAATSVVEETVRSCLLPVFKELLKCVTGGTRGMFNAGLALNPPVQLSMVGSVSGAGMGLDERWKQQQILELEVFLKRTELVQEQIKSVLEELKSTGDGQSKSASEEIKSVAVEQSKSPAIEELGSHQCEIYNNWYQSQVKHPNEATNPSNWSSRMYQVELASARRQSIEARRPPPHPPHRSVPIDNSEAGILIDSSAAGGCMVAHEDDDEDEA